MNLKRIISSIFIILFLTPSLLVNIWYYYQLIIIKKDVEENFVAKIKTTEIVKLTLNKNEVKSILKWENYREFEYNQIMYDVIKIEENGSNIIYYCWKDVKETLFKNNFLKYLYRDLNSNKIQYQIIVFFELFNSNLFLETINLNFFYPKNSSIHQFFYQINYKFLKIIKSTIPPEYFFYLL